MQSRGKKQKPNVGGDATYWQEVLAELENRAQARRNARRNFEANLNNPIDLSSRLALETVVDNIVPHLDTKDMVNAKKVSHGWRNVFASELAIEKHWRQEFKKNFRFDIDLLRQALDSEIITGSEIRTLYKNFTTLLNAYHPKMPNYVKYMLQDNDNLELLLLCAAGNNTALLARIEQDLYPMWFELACYTNNTNIARALYRQLIYSAEEIDQSFMHYLRLADRVSSTDLTKALIDITHEFTTRRYKPRKEEQKQTKAYTAEEQCHPRYTQNIIAALKSGKLKSSQQLLDASVRAGNYDLTTFILEKTNTPLKIDINTINRAALSGNMRLLERLLNIADQKGIAPNRMTLNAAANSGSIACTEMLSARYGLAFMTDTLNAALQSGQIELINHIIQARPLIDIRLESRATYEYAKESGNASLYEYYLPCYSHILEILSLEQDGEADPEFMRNHLSIAYQIAPTFFKQIIGNILEQPEEYHLTDNEVAIIQNSRTYSHAFGDETEEVEQNNINNMR